MRFTTCGYNSMCGFNASYKPRAMVMSWSASLETAVGVRVLLLSHQAGDEARVDHDGGLKREAIVHGLHEFPSLLGLRALTVDLDHRGQRVHARLDARRLHVLEELLGQRHVGDSSILR